MRIRAAARRAASVVAVAGLTLLGPATPVVLGHSQLVASLPGAGETLDGSPSELRLVFSEPIEPAHSRLDLLDEDGNVVAAGIGGPDPADPYTMVAAIEELPDGVYTVEWRALSAADGHTTAGFFTFGVGMAGGGMGGGHGMGDGLVVGGVHPGHDPGWTAVETASRSAGSLGFLLAFGFPLINWLVLRHGGVIGLSRAVIAALLLGAAGAMGLLVVGGSDPGMTAVSYATGSRTGGLLVVRIFFAVIAAIAVAILATRRPGLSIIAGSLAGLGGLVLIAIAGHAAAYASPAPIVAMIVHLIAVAIWISGLLTIAWFATFGRRSHHPLTEIVPRFSALALVAVGLIGMTGVYSDWIQTRAVISLDTEYGRWLAAKTAIALAAFAFGGLNYLSGGRKGDRLFPGRVAIESLLAFGIIAATAVLASGSPPASERPVAISPAPSSVIAAGPPPVLELAPGRPGPTRFIVTMTPLPEGAVAELQLQRLDTDGQSRVPFRASPKPGVFEVTGGVLPPDSRWDASVVVRGADEREMSRTRYGFALDQEGISAGRALPPIDLAFVVAVVLILGAAVGGGYALAGGRLPKVEPGLGRAAMLVGSATAAAVGVVCLFGGPAL